MISSSVTLSVLYVINKHVRVIEETSYDTEGSLAGCLRDEATLQFIINEVNEMQDPFEKAACFMYKTATRHPFVQGNKRIAFAIAHSLLMIAGWVVIVDGDTLYNFGLAVARDEMTQEEIKAWFLNNVKKREGYYH